MPDPSTGSGDAPSPDPLDPRSVDLVAAALRADRADLAPLAEVLTSSLAQALPAGMVEVQRARSLTDRVSGRPGRVRSVTVRTDRAVLLLRQGAPGAVEAEVQRVVRGVVIAREPVDLAAWSAALAAELTRRAEADAAARAALLRLLGG